MPMPRDLERISHLYDWKVLPSSEDTAWRQMKLDTTPSGFAKLARDFDVMPSELGWKRPDRGGSDEAAAPIVLDTVPTDAMRTSQRFPRDLDQTDEWKRNSSSSNALWGAIPPLDTSPSPDSGHLRELERLSPIYDWKSTSSPNASWKHGSAWRQLKPDTTVTPQAQQTPSPPGWKPSSRQVQLFGGPPRVDLEPLASHPSAHQFRSEVGDTASWSPAGRATAAWTPPQIDTAPSTGAPPPVVARTLARLSAIYDWKLAGKASARRAPRPSTASVVDAASVQSFAFRELGKHGRAAGWNSSAKVPAALDDFNWPYRPLKVRVRKLKAPRGGQPWAAAGRGARRSRASRRGEGASWQKEPSSAEKAQASAETVMALVLYLEQVMATAVPGGNAATHVAVVVECLVDAGCSTVEVDRLVAAARKQAHLRSPGLVPAPAMSMVH